MKQYVRGCHFHNSSEIHYRHLVSDVHDHRQVVSDKQIGEVELLLQVI